jgi:hypothetical protein
MRWAPVVNELSGLLALESGNLEDARAYFKRLADDPAAPASARGRAARILAVIGAEE